MKNKYTGIVPQTYSLHNHLFLSCLIVSVTRKINNFNMLFNFMLNTLQMHC